MTNGKTITLEQLFRFYRSLPHQTAAISELEADLKANGYDTAMVRNRPWFQTWSQAGKIEDLSPALQIIKQFEGFVPRAYPDPLSGGAPWTIGYGTTRYADGKAVQKGDVVTLEEASRLLAEEVEDIEARLALAIPRWREMTSNQHCALISFAYNLGTNFFDSPGFETITKVLKERRWGDVPEALMLYRNPGSNVESGLKRRRAAEGNLWLLGLNDLPIPQTPPASVVFMPSSSFSTKLTRHIDYGEFALYKEVRRFEHQYQCQTALELAQFLEKVRGQFGKPLVITSGYRPPAVNRAVNGASSSEHLYNAPGVGAVDFYVEGIDIYKVQDYCLANWPYSVGKGANKGFVHVGIRQGRPKIQWNY